jgi:hypothetical protein
MGVYGAAVPKIEIFTYANDPFSGNGCPKITVLQAGWER